MRKVPTIVLSITYKGVKFIDAANKVSYRMHTLPRLAETPLFNLSSHVIHQIEPSPACFFVIVNVMPASFCQICSCLYFLTGGKFAHIDIYLTLIIKDLPRLPWKLSPVLLCMAALYVQL